MQERLGPGLAAELRAAGADLIDVGAVPGQVCRHMGEIVRELRNAGHRVSIDSFEQTEVEAAVAAGAELILSCNQSNLEWVSRLGVEVVAVPETPQDADSLDRLAEQLTDRGCRFRLDPILEPGDRVVVGTSALSQFWQDLIKTLPAFALFTNVNF